jgi:hypothetical protein
MKLTAFAQRVLQPKYKCATVKLGHANEFGDRLSLVIHMRIAQAYEEL